MQQKTLVEIKYKTKQTLLKKLLDCKSKINLNKNLFMKKYYLL